MLAPSAARSASVSGDIATTGNGKGAGGTTELFAYSEETVGRVITKNALVLGLESFKRANGTQVAAPIPGFGVLADGTCIVVGVGLGGCRVGPNNAIYGPPVAGVRGLAKPVAPFTTQSGSSTTGVFMGLGFFDRPTNTISAFGTGGNGIGKAAGAAFDPVSVSPGTYAYQEVIDASLQLDNVLDTGGVTFFAVDSRLTDPDTFYALGEPLNTTLWYLTVAENGALTSLSDLLDPTKFDVTFKINDRTLLNPVDSSGTPYTDAMIASSVRNAFSLVGNTATLPPFMLFPSAAPGSALPGTTNYLVSGPIQYGEGLNAGLTTVSEPSGLALLALGGLLLRGRALRRGRNASATASDVAIN